MLDRRKRQQERTRYRINRPILRRDYPRRVRRWGRKLRLTRNRLPKQETETDPPPADRSPSQTLNPLSIGFVEPLATGHVHDFT